MADPLVQALAVRERELLADNPFISGGNSVAGMRTANVLDPWGSLAAALGQGVIGGVMKGIGENQVENQYAQDASLLDRIRAGQTSHEGTIWNSGKYQPFLREYVDELAKEKIAQERASTNMLIKALLQKPSLQTVEEGGKKTTYSFDPFSRLAGALGGQQGNTQSATSDMERMGFKKVAESAVADKNPYNSVPNDLKLQIMQAPAMLQEFDDVEKGLRAYGADNTGYVFAKHFGFTDAYALQKRIDLLTANLKKAFEGSRSSDFDQKTYTQLLNGNWSTIKADNFANLIGQAKSILANKAVNNMNTIDQLRSDPAQVRQQLQQYLKSNANVSMGSSLNGVNVIQPEGLPSAPTGYMWRRKSR